MMAKNDVVIALLILLNIAIITVLFVSCTVEETQLDTNDNTTTGTGSGGADGTDSGGDTPPTDPFPPAYDCTDGDGGVNFDVSSFCEDSYHMLGFADSCDGYYAIDYWCDEEGICQSSRQYCNYPNEICVGGVCQPIPCDQRLNPQSQSDCDVGYCDVGDCKFYPATLVSPSRCGCETY